MSLSRKNRCLKCDEPFEAPEFFSFMLKLKSRTVRCLRCQTENYFVPKWTIGYILTLLGSAFIGLIIFLGGILLLSTYDAYGTSRTPIWAIILSVFIGIGFVWFVLNIYTWKFRELSTDRQYKSISDYD